MPNDKYTNQTQNSRIKKYLSFVTSRNLGDEMRVAGEETVCDWGDRNRRENDYMYINI